LTITDEASTAAAASFVGEHFGCLDVLINNAAVGGLTAGSLKERMESTLATNVTGPALVSSAFRPLLLKSLSPRSLLISSGAGIASRASAMKAHRLRGGEPYCVCKAALNMLVVQEHLVHEDQGLKVFAVSPSFVISNLRGEDEDARN